MIDISKAISSNAYMVIDRIPDLSFFVKTIQIPVMTNGQTTVPAPQHYQWKVPSVHTNIEDVSILWYLDENYKTYFAIIKWLSSLRTNVDVKDGMSDVSIIILNNAKMPIIKITLIDAWPTKNRSLEFDTVSTDPLAPFVMFSCSTIKWEYMDGSDSGEY